MEWPADPELTRLVAGVGAAVRLPRMSLVARRGRPAPIGDVGRLARAEVRRVLAAGSGGRGGEVAVGVGSRGIAHLRDLVAATVDELRGAGYRPFVVPAMGSHGGGTAGGQRAVLAGYGITEAALGVPVRATMETAVVGEVEGTPVHLDRYVAEAGRAFLVARVKPHTDFQAAIESGPAKMAAIGLGKQVGAQAMHGQGLDGLRRVMPAIGRYLADRYLLGALAVVEDQFDQTHTVRGLSPGEIGRDGETALLGLARRSLPRLPATGIDTLVVERMGKDVSGTGMDPNVIGRWLVPGLPEPEAARTVVVLDLTESSHGNGIGLGLADFAPARLLSKVDLRALYLNVMTSGWAGLRRGRLPIVLPTDRDAIVAAVGVCGPVAARAARLVWIRDTLHTATCAVSEALWPEVAADPELELVGEPFALPFRGDGRLASWHDQVGERGTA